MILDEAIHLIRPGVIPAIGTWADIGAGTGLFTEALIEILEEGKVIALDKSPHGLYANKQLAIGNKQNKVNLEIVEGDFNRLMALPALDGILMANALHYATDHLLALKNVLTSLKPGGTFILVEYDTDEPNPPWVPNPVSLNKFRELCGQVSLKDSLEIGRRKSIYQDGEMYVVTTSKHESVDH